MGPPECLLLSREDGGDAPDVGRRPRAGRMSNDLAYCHELWCGPRQRLGGGEIPGGTVTGVGPPIEARVGTNERHDLPREAGSGTSQVSRAEEVLGENVRAGKQRENSTSPTHEPEDPSPGQAQR